MIYKRQGLSSKAFVLVLLAWLCLIAAVLPSSAQFSERPDGWTEASHGNRVPANYDIVLPDDRINELYITFTPESWEAEEADMVEIYGERGQGEARPAGGPGGFGRRNTPDVAALAAALDRDEQSVREAIALMPDFAAVAAHLDMEMDALVAALGLPLGFAPPPAFARGGPAGSRPGQAGAGWYPGLQLGARNPIWAPVTIQFNGETWWEVGFRYKGNSTLMTGWRSGANALPFKLDFDEFEDEHPALDNQRFYGFKQLSFANGEFDPSLQREKVTADIFRDAGVPSAQTAYYAVYVDRGAGTGFDYWGIYTAVELPDDTLIETQFDDDDGNMYKPSGAGATFAAGSFNEDSFDKETNRNSSYDDVLAVFAALHADTRLREPPAWRAHLESVFDVQGFLQWLAANLLVQNWDTYGATPHNYYLYADATSGQLAWIPWDNNMSLSSTTGLRDVLSLELAEIDAERWPLIGYLMQDSVYRADYRARVESISNEVFTPARMIPIYESNYELLTAYLSERADDSILPALRAATDELIDHVQARAEAADAFLANVLD